MWMKKILAIGASSSRNSINRKLAGWAASQVPEAKVDHLDLNFFEMPIYSMDREKGGGIPELAARFLETVRSNDGVVISMAEHNGAYTAAFKNIYDWVSRLEYRLWSDKPMFLLSTSPGARGAATVFELASNSFPRLGADIQARFSLPSFDDNFSEESGIVAGPLRDQFDAELASFIKSLNK